MNKNEKKILVLASNSPRRSEILAKAGIDFVKLPANNKEKATHRMAFTEELLIDCAKEKALNVRKQVEMDKKYSNYDKITILAADTIVVCDGIIYGKPVDRDDAIDILMTLSEKVQIVMTCIYMIEINDILNVAKDKVVYDIDKTFVTFRKLSRNEIENYIDKYSPYDKAGAYGIQETEFDFVVKVEGDFDNVVGLPIKKVKKTLANF